MTQTDQGSAVSRSIPRFPITGAKGFIGAWIVRELVDRGDQPWIFDNDTESARLAALLDLGGVQRTPLEDGIRQTPAIFERLKLAGTLGTKDLET
jgi:nucleoside-diphosphate-sugar epimerase